jgi:hypothetical protein
MSETKINPLIALISRRLQIIQLFLGSPIAPNFLPLVILPDIVQFRKSIQDQIHTSNPNQSSIAPPIIRFIIIAINVRGDDVSQLYSHVVKCGGNGACSYRVCIPGLKRNLDGVDVWVCRQKSEKDETDPR